MVRGVVKGHRVWSGPGKHCEDDINTITSSVTRELMAADEIVFCRSRSQGFVVGVEGGREKWVSLWSWVNCCKKLKSTEKQLIIG